MGLTEEQKVSVGAFAQNFERATVGLQLKNMHVPPLTMEQYAAALAAALYASSRVNGPLPDATDSAGFRDFVVASAQHYGASYMTVSNEAARELLDAVTIPEHLRVGS